MDSQKLAHSSSGHESHGVHVCHKCGWPFPNPHPSAKHRRAHKKVCGSIEGYKLAVDDLEGSAHSNVSIDEHLSDEDREAASPNSKVSEASGSLKGSGGAGELLPNRSEDEVFSDAVAEFVDGGAGIVVGARGAAADVGELAVNVEKVLEKGSDAIPSFECGPVADVEAVKPPGTTTDSSQVQHSKTPESTNNILTNAPESPGLLSSSTMTSVSDCQIEIKKDASLESEKTKAVNMVFDSSSTSTEQGTDVQGKKESVSDTTGEVAGETAEVMEPLQEKSPEDGFVCSKIPETEVRAEVESIEHAVADARDVSDGINSVNSDYVIEKNGEADANVHLISVPDDVHEVDNPKIMLEDFKDHKVLNLHQSANSEFGLSEDKGDEIKGLALEVSDQSAQSESTTVSAPASDVLVNDVAVKEEADLPQISESQRSEREVMAPQMDKIASDSSPAETNEISSEALPKLSPDGTVQPTLLVGDDHHEKTVNSVISGDHNSEAAIKDDYTGKPVTLPESAVSASENHVKPPSDLREGEHAGSYLEHAVVAHEPAEKSSGLGADQETELYDVGEYEKIETEKDDVTGDACGVAIHNVKDETRVDNNDGPTAESAVENVVVTPEPSIEVTEPHVHPANGLEEGNVTSDHGTKTEKDLPMQTPESATHLQESQTVVENVMVSDTQLAKEKPNGNDESHEVAPALNSVENQVKERTLSPSDAKLSVQIFPAAEDSSAKESDVVSVFGSESFQGESDRPQLGGSVMDLSGDSNSQTDSLENNWGSVSVLSLQSEAQAVIDAETISTNESRVAVQEEINSKQLKPSTEGQHPEKSDMFEPPSFMTLVEPMGKNDQKSKTSEAQASQNPQQPNTSALQAGWFPSITHVAHESQGRKKNEEIIAKVTNWSAGGKQHTPLKSLLGEASLETRAKSPKHKDVPQKGDKPATTVNSILAPESPLGRPADKEIGKEWDSPARYQTEIKREKRKPKSRPYWAQFMCCSSVH